MQHRPREQQTTLHACRRDDRERVDIRHHWQLLQPADDLNASLSLAILALVLAPHPRCVSDDELERNGAADAVGDDNMRLDPFTRQVT